MENESNSLLELPLESSEILEEVNLTTNNVVVTDTNVDSVGEMLIDENASSNIPGLGSNSIDFEFSNSDLGNGTDFSIDHQSVFSIVDNEIDVRDNCDDIFRDSACFSEGDTCTSKQNTASASLQNSIVSVPGFSKTNLYKDLGLKLQVIPLNNLQYVSTIQTSRGLHILAIPAQTSLNVDYSTVNVKNVGQKVKPCLGLDINQSFGNFPDNKIIVTGNRIQPRIEEMPGFQLDLVKKTTKNNVSNYDRKEHSKGPPEAKNVKKFRNADERKLDVCRKNSLRKGYVQRLLTNKGLLKKKKNKTLYIDVIKTPSTNKSRMVSLLKASVTNGTKQKNDFAGRNQETGNKKEVKLTFHLKQDAEEKVNDIKGKQALKSGNGPKERKLVNRVQRSTSQSEQKNLKSPKSKSQMGKQEKQASDKLQRLESPYSKTSASQTGLPLNKVTVSETTNKCKICLATFHRKGNFENHMKAHYEITACTAVNQDEITAVETKDMDISLGEERITSLSVEGTLENEEKLSALENERLQDNYKPLKCEFCALEFKIKGNLIRHKLTHSMDSTKKIQGRYQCNDCNKSFLQKCDLKRHVATHSGTYPFICSICNKGFIRRSDLSVHEKFHAKEKRYKCQLCSKAYYQSGDLSRHMRKNHGEVCAFACQDCGKKYTTQKTLSLHIRAKH